MKHLIFILSFFFSVSLYSQSVQCYKCSKKTEIKTNIVISGNSFTGLLIKRPNKADVLLHAPIQISNKNKWFRMEDLYGTKLELDISTLGSNLNTINKFYDFVGSCFCTSDEASFNIFDSEVDGVENTLYVDTSNARLYLWNGTEYVFYNGENGGNIESTAFGEIYTPIQRLVETSPSIGDEVKLSYVLKPNSEETQGGAVTELVDFDSLTNNYIESGYGKYQKFVTSHGWEAGLFGNPSGNIQTIMGVDNYGNSKRSNLKLIWEYGYKLGNKLHTEFHLEALDTLGRKFRPITSIQPYDGSYSDVRFTADYTGFSKSPNNGAGNWEDRNFITGLENYNYDKQIVITDNSTNPILSKYGNTAIGELSLLQLESDDRFKVGNYKGIKVANSIYMQQSGAESYPTFYSSNNIFQYQGSVYQNLQSGQTQINSITANNANPFEINFSGSVIEWAVPGLRKLFSIKYDGTGVGINTNTPSEILELKSSAGTNFGRKNIRLGGVTNISETNYNASAYSAIGRNIAATGTGDGYQYIATNFGLQGIFFEDNNIGFDIQTGGGTANAAYTRSPKIQFFGDGKVKISSLPTYADDTAAGAGGLTTGYVYKTSTGELRIKL